MKIEKIRINHLKVNKIIKIQLTITIINKIKNKMTHWSLSLTIN